MMSPGTLPAGTVRVGHAARLALLQRVGGAVGDDLQSQLQPILLIYEIFRATLARPDPDTAALRQHAEGIKSAVERAMKANAAAAEWLLPLREASTSSTDLAAECSELLRPGFELSGLRIELACEGEAFPVARSQGRTMLCAVLAHAADRADGPASLLVKLAHRDDLCEARVSVRSRSATGAIAADFLQPQHAALSWEDLLALAQLERAAVRREDDGTVVLQLERSIQAGR